MGRIQRIVVILLFINASILPTALATIENNKIVNNTANILRNDSGGGGIYQCYGLICNNIIQYNSAINGGGGGLYECDGQIQNNYIIDNMARDYGGGLYKCDGLIYDNDIISQLDIQCIIAIIIENININDRKSFVISVNKLVT